MSDIDNNEYYARYSFSRRSGEFSSFSLTPDKTSFYKLTNKASKSANVFVSYEKRTLWWSETISVEQEEDGTYLLNGGTEYTIETYGVQSGGYSFTVEQDNWVYAPNGGLWTVEEYGAPFGMVSSPYERIFITPKLLVEATIESLPNHKDYSVFECYTKEDVDKIIAMIEHSASETAIEEYKSTLNSIVTGVGFALVIIGFGVESVAISAIIEVIGNTCTVTSGFLWLTDMLQQMEWNDIKRAAESGNAAIECIYIPSNYPARVWEAWSTPLYINKFYSGDRGNVTSITVDDVKFWLNLN